MFDANTANRREQLWFSQFGNKQNELIIWATGIISSALIIGHLAGVL